MATQAAKTKAIMEHQAKLADDSRRKMDAKAEKVKRAMEKKMEAKRQEVEEQRRKAEEKIKTVVDRNKKVRMETNPKDCSDDKCPSNSSDPLT